MCAPPPCALVPFLCVLSYISFRHEGWMARGGIAMSVQFVDGWTITQVLGEGAFGEVKLLMNNDTRDVLAVKIINTALHPEAQTLVRKEIAIHRALSHVHIIKYFGHRTEPSLEYIFLEYASGGELFNKIEPDYGMESWEANKYFTQMVSGVEYLHGRGVSHRDIKPENILLDDNDNVKISDFGMATMFRKNGCERLLDKKCGTMPYVAPEVLLRPYHAGPADVWSCGIVLVALLAGELPWDSPTANCQEFVSWKNNTVTVSPWNKLDNNVLSLLRKLLVPLPDKRLTASQILKHRWCTAPQRSDNVARRTAPVTPASKRTHSGRTDLSPGGFLVDDVPARACFTQPLPIETPDRGVVEGDSDRLHCFTQPTHLDDLLLSSQLHPTQATCLSSYQKLIRRMTRFFLGCSVEDSITKVSVSLEGLGCTWKRGPPSVLTFNTLDRRRNPLVFKANFIAMEQNVLVDFRLSSGCGLEFKKLFLKARQMLGDLVIKGHVTWPAAPCT